MPASVPATPPTTSANIPQGPTSQLGGVGNQAVAPQSTDVVKTSASAGSLGVNLSTDDKLDLALQAIEEAEVLAPATLESIAQTSTPSPTPVVGGKERAAAVSPDVAVVDAGGLGAVEYEPTPETPPEVEEYVKRVEDHAELLSEPIVVDGKQIDSVNSHHPTQPVVVLPITEEDEKKARFKSPKYSIRWLVEFSHKIIKKFVGKVIYRVDE